MALEKLTRASLKILTSEIMVESESELKTYSTGPTNIKLDLRFLRFSVRCYNNMVGGRRMSEMDNTDVGFVQMVINPSKTLANWFVGLGALGIFLAILNLMGEIHPNDRVSWSGVLTFEFTNKAFEDMSTAPSFVISDIIFIVICGTFAILGLKTINSQDGGIGAWAKSIFVNQTWMSLANPDLGGW